MKTLPVYLVCLFFAILSISCEDNPNNDDDPVSKGSLSGYVQKGPYNNGTNITLFELDNNFTQTGKNYYTQITDNQGQFEFKNISVKSNYVELIANGFYFDEVAGKNSAAQLTLYAISDISDKNDLNVNILTNLEKQRVEYLLSKGSSFSEAKKQAQREVLSIFNIEKEDITSSELLDIIKEGDDNAILLAISVILQGTRTVAELSEIMANISTDIKEDGILTSESTGSDLINQAKYLNNTNIRENLKNKFESMGVSIHIPEFEKYVNTFIDSAEFLFNNGIVYPEFSDYGRNILFGEIDTFDFHTSYSLAAEVPKGGSLKIVLEGGIWFYQSMPNGPVNWDIAEYNFSLKKQTFEIIEPGEPSDLIIEFDVVESNDITLLYYENGSETPTKIKNLYIKGGQYDESESIEYPKKSSYGYENILDTAKTNFQSLTSYSLSANVPYGQWIMIVIKGGSWEIETDAINPENWIIEDYNEDSKSQVFLSAEYKKEHDLVMHFNPSSEQEDVVIEYYEIDFSEPKFTKSITVSDL